MICWIASYPKSGNTFCRILLSEYLYGDLNQPFNFSGIDKINQFPSLYYYNSLLKNNIINKENLEKNKLNVLKHSVYLQKQEFSNSLFYLKTHSSYFNEQGCQFTDSSISACAIYLVRDPRNVLLSYSEYLNESVDATFEKMNSENFVYQKYKEKWYPIYKIDSWKNNYLSWKKAQLQLPVKIVKYEDLVLKTTEVFLDILIFLKKYVALEINLERLNKVINRTTFVKLQELETKGLFQEMNNLNKNGIFFKKGAQRNWKVDSLNSPYNDKILNIWNQEILQLQY